LLIVSPAPRPFWPLSGRNSTYPTVQICRAGSQYGNGAATAYDYDEKTFRLTSLKTTRAAGGNGVAAQIFANAATVQDLRYTYDPTGNITRIEDAALKTIFSGQKVDPVCHYSYDPLYRLIDATGREHIGQSAFAPPDGNYRDYPFVGPSAQNDLQALRTYIERYDYDPVGNFKTMAHLAGNGAGNWTRGYTYNQASLIEPAKKSNRLSQTALQAGANPAAEPYGYDAHGNMVRMPHLPMMQWDFKDQLGASSRQVVNAGAPETTYYVYDAGGQRARKITERQNGARKNERFYLGGFEVYREYGSGLAPTLERETLHVMDDKQRIALVETTKDENPLSLGERVRYQLGNHLGSASLELDGAGGLISYEEYSPYGATVFQARSAAEVSLKRYRYTGKERDEENGFTYHGARYYAPWLGRWVSCDPAGLGGGIDFYIYGLANPIKFVDPNGKECAIPQQCAADAINDPAKVEAARVFLSLPMPTAMKQFGLKTTDEYTKFGDFLKQQGLTPRTVGATGADNKGQTSIGVDANYWAQQRAYQDFSNVGNSALASATYAVATANGASPEFRSALTQAASTYSDVAAAAAATATGRAQTKALNRSAPSQKPEIVPEAPPKSEPPPPPPFADLPQAPQASSGSGTGSKLPSLRDAVAEVKKVGPPPSKQTVAGTRVAEGSNIGGGSGRGLTAKQRTVAKQLGLEPSIDLPEHIHAELKTIYTAGERGQLPTEGVTTNEMCPKCEGTFKDLTKDSPYEFKLDPDRKSWQIVPRGTK
jgi:RHS repeat-associated protein